MGFDRGKKRVHRVVIQEYFFLGEPIVVFPFIILCFGVICTLLGKSVYTCYMT